MAGKRRALIVANDQYDNEGLSQLRAPSADAEALRRVLADPAVADFTVQVVHNEPAHLVQAQIDDLFSDGRPDDLLLLHFSCHGLKSESGELFFAARNTNPTRLVSTATSAEFVRKGMRSSRSRSIVLLLDCCYGGAFTQGATVRAAGNVNVLDSFSGGKLGGGRGRAVITASTSMEYAFEGGQLTGTAGQRPSVFTAAVVDGLATGDADRDEDGWVSVNDLYDYVFDKVQEQNPHQTPSSDFQLQGELYLARSQRLARTRLDVGTRPPAPPDPPPLPVTPKPPGRVAASPAPGWAVVLGSVLLCVPVIVIALHYFQPASSALWWAALLAAVLGIAVSAAGYRQNRVWVLALEGNLAWCLVYALYEPELSFTSPWPGHFTPLLFGIAALVNLGLFPMALSRPRTREARSPHPLLAYFPAVMALGLAASALAYQLDYHLVHYVLYLHRTGAVILLTALLVNLAAVGLSRTGQRLP